MSQFYSVLTKNHQRLFDSKELFLLQITVCFIFLGRAWQSIFMNIPLTELLWDEYLLHDWVEWLGGCTWEHYVKHSDGGIQRLQTIIGLIWLACAGLSWTNLRWAWSRWLFGLGTVLLFGLSFLYFKEMFYSWGQWAEYSLQAFSPWVLYAVARGKAINSSQLRFALQMMIAVTFFSHGLYAYGYYPQPAAWVDWCMRVFFMDEKTARAFLTVIGVLDMLKLLIIFLPIRWLQLSMIWYCVLWGFMTALARVVANFSHDLLLEALLQYLPETLFRIVHGAIPLLLVWLWRAEVNKSANLGLYSAQSQ